MEGECGLENRSRSSPLGWVPTTHYCRLNELASLYAHPCLESWGVDKKHCLLLQSCFSCHGSHGVLFAFSVPFLRFVELLPMPW